MKRKIWRVRVDLNRSQWIVPVASDAEHYSLLTLDCKPKPESIYNVKWKILDPLSERSSFYSIGGSGGFIFDQKVFESELRTMLEMAGQVIPLNVSGERMYLMNVLACPNTLDEGNTEFDRYDDGSRGRILRYAFHTSLVYESSLFKIPETRRAEILTYAGAKDPLDEFVGCYNHLGLSGLQFEFLFEG